MLLKTLGPILVTSNKILFHLFVAFTFIKLRGVQNDDYAAHFFEEGCQAPITVTVPDGHSMIAPCPTLTFDSFDLI